MKNKELRKLKEEFVNRAMKEDMSFVEFALYSPKEVPKYYSCWIVSPASLTKDQAVEILKAIPGVKTGQQVENISICRSPADALKVRRERGYSSHVTYAIIY